MYCLTETSLTLLAIWKQRNVVGIIWQGSFTVIITFPVVMFLKMTQPYRWLEYTIGMMYMNTHVTWMHFGKPHVGARVGASST